MMEQCFLSGDRRVVQHVRLVRLPRAARVRPCQLRRQGRRQVGGVKSQVDSIPILTFQSRPLLKPNIN